MSLRASFVCEKSIRFLFKRRKTTAAQFYKQAKLWKHGTCTKYRLWRAWRNIEAILFVLVGISQVVIQIFLTEVFKFRHDKKEIALSTTNLVFYTKTKQKLIELLS